MIITLANLEADEKAAVAQLHQIQGALSYIQQLKAHLAKEEPQPEAEAASTPAE